MLIFTLPSGPLATNAYILGCEETRLAAIVDPGLDSASSILSALKKEGLTPTKILLTHSHWDHIGNVALLKKELAVPVWIHQLDVPNLIHPGADHLPMITPVEGVDPDGCFNEGDTIEIGHSSLSVIHTPGHTPGSVCFYSKEHQILISGDTLFKGSIGKISFPTSEPDRMWLSLKKLETLPPKTKVYPGHGSATTIGEESWLPRAKSLFDK